MATKGSDLKDLVGGTIEVELLNGTAFIAELFGYDAITRTAVFHIHLNVASVSHLGFLGVLSLTLLFSAFHRSV